MTIFKCLRWALSGENIRRCIKGALLCARYCSMSTDLILIRTIPAHHEFGALNYFANEEIEVQRGKVTWPRSHSQLMAEFLLKRSF